MEQNQFKRKTAFWNSIIILLSAIGLIACIIVLFPQTRHKILDIASQILNKESSTYQAWIDTLLSYAMGGICFILFFDYCTLTKSGKALVNNIKQEIKDCLSGIEFKLFTKPVLLMFGVYLLGILTIIRSNVLYMDDIGRATGGWRAWITWSRYIPDFLSIFIHGDANLTEISPLPQLLAILILSLSSVLLVYVLFKKITVIPLLASIPLGLSPYFLECLSYKFDAPYMAISIIACIIPFLFVEYKRAFIFTSIVSLLIMCMNYQAASGIYIMIAVILCFQDWNSKKKPIREILVFLGISFFAFCLSMIMYKLFFVRSYTVDTSTTAMFSLSKLIPGVLSNIKNYILLINSDFGLIWKIIIVIIFIFFIIKSIYKSSHRKLISFIVSSLVLFITLIASYGAYYLLESPQFFPRGLYGFGVFLAIICVFISDYKKSSIVASLALCWCFLVFAFSYGNALADQDRYANFRLELLLHDLSILYPERNIEDMSFQMKNSIGYTPVVKNIAKHNPIIKRLVTLRVEEDDLYSHGYFLGYFNWGMLDSSRDFSYGKNYVDYNKCDLPVVLDSYYHTIKSDGDRVLIILKN